MRSRRLALSEAVSVVGLAATSASAWATFPATSGRIAFASDATGDLDIFTTSPSGSGIVDVTGDPSAPAFALEPDSSPDGTKIAFRSGRTAAADAHGDACSHHDLTGAGAVSRTFVRDSGLVQARGMSKTQEDFS